MSFAGVLEAGEAYTLDYYADHDGDGECTTFPTDHMWHQSIGTATGHMSGTIDHSGGTIDEAGCDSF